jgi:hypothetical protein
LFTPLKIVEPVLIGMVGDPIRAQGFLYGKVNKKGKISGENNAYIYPDYETALVGRFEDNFMKSGRLAKISAVTCQSGMIHVKFDEPDPKSPVYFYDPSSNVSMGSIWYLKDPFEDKQVELKESTIPGAGLGLFTKVDIPAFKVPIPTTSFY